MDQKNHTSVHRILWCMQFSIIPFVNLVNKGKIFWYCKEQGWCQRQHLPVSHASYLPRKSAKSKWWGAVHPSLAIVSICSMAYIRQLVFFSYHWHDTDANTDICKYMTHMMSKYFETGEMWRQQRRWLVKSESAGAWKVSNEFVESWIGSNCIKGTAAPLNSLKKTSVTSRRHLNLNVKRILRNEGLPKTPCNFTSIRYLSVDTDPLWLLDILRCCVLLELSQTQRL